ncbi:SPOR domain-containing protein [Pontibacter qinzhouensis]|uniref:SPOR domain-containing protein n=1 Tax=Pontibacter qinzhouensis TaxID=2603253 RepID=A0A5C8K9A8_9BACT|nr:SPOR domain-containing protein [Pontibacter qinzhouensis]TXK47682.1 SPOR domain-containing protein [Pontibacter qinzhouensis]
MVDKQIEQLLREHDCVIIPDFGGLIARYVSARIQPVKHALLPPSKKIAFNEKLVLSDGLLISAVARHKNVSQEDAGQLVADFVAKAKQKLQEENRFMLQNIGSFRYNVERKLEFVFAEGDNLLDASFGLPDLVARPLRASEPAVLRTLVKERQPVALAAKPTFRSRLKKAYTITAGLLIGSLTVSALYLLSLQTDYNLSSLNPLSLVGIGGGTSQGKIFSKYAPDFVPLTEEERLGWYLPLAPVPTPTEEAAPLGPFVSSEAEIQDENTALVFGTTTLPGESDKAVNEIVKSEDVKVVPAKEETPAHILAGKTGRFYIITGGYSSLKNAEVSRAEIKKKQIEAKILLPAPGHKLLRVSVADFATPEEAAAAIGTYRKTFGETIWVLNN